MLVLDEQMKFTVTSSPVGQVFYIFFLVKAKYIYIFELVSLKRFINNTKSYSISQWELLKKKTLLESYFKFQVLKLCSQLFVKLDIVVCEHCLSLLNQSSLIQPSASRRENTNCLYFPSTKPPVTFPVQTECYYFVSQ